MTTAILVLLFYFTDAPMQVSITPERDMNTCHDHRTVADNTARVYNETHETQKIRQWTALCIDLSRWMEDQQRMPARHVF